MPERCTSVSVLLEAMRHMICNTVVPNMTGLTSQPQTKSSKRRFSTITLSAFAHRQPIISTSGWGTVPSLRLPACHHSLLRDFLDVAARRFKDADSYPRLTGTGQQEAQQEDSKWHSPEYRGQHE
eukprot:603642-Pelagomonas_calceolata.AAC.6